MSKEIDRVIIPEDRVGHLEEYLIQPDHRVTIQSKETSIDTVTLDSNGFNWDNKGREHLETDKAECECGWNGNTISEAENHLQEMAEQGSPCSQIVRETLEGVALHGFEFNGTEGHGSSLVWQHQELGLKMYATPTSWLMNESGTISIQLQGFMDTPFDQMNGMNGEKIEFTDGLTFKEYIEIVRDYVENNLLKSRWESRDSETHEIMWENQHNEDFLIVIDEIEDGYKLYATAGISECPYETSSDRTELVQKAIHYMNENPLGKPEVSYQKVIENSDDHRYTGEKL